MTAVSGQFVSSPQRGLHSELEERLPPRSARRWILKTVLERARYSFASWKPMPMILRPGAGTTGDQSSSRQRRHPARRRAKIDPA
jgi:hypothetical protein